MSLKKEARRDAYELAKALMSYGEGARERRQLITNTVQRKSAKSPAYEHALRDALGRQDMVEIAIKVRREIERSRLQGALSKSSRELAPRKYQSRNTGLMAAITTLYLVHQTGLDRAIYEEIRNRYDAAKRNRRVRKNTYTETLAEPLPPL